MNVFLILGLAVGLILILMRRKVPLGLSMLAGGLILWLLKDPDPKLLFQAGGETLRQHRTYDLLAALYFVMCLEIELRTSGVLANMVQVLQRLFSGNRITMAAMPAFLGLLPSLGGARFSAPIVEEAAKELGLTPAHKAAVNFWFRHPFEFCNPIIPGMILACSIAQVPYSQFVVHIGWVTVIYLIVGWFVLMAPIKEAPLPKALIEQQYGHISDLFIALSPVFITFALVMFCNLNASLAMGYVVVFLFCLLKLLGRSVSLKAVILDAIDKKMFMNVLCILYFIQILTDTKLLQELVVAFRTAPLPVPVIIAGIAFMVGIITGMSQAHIAIVMPIVAAVDPGNLDLAATAMVFGLGGHMLTPTHMCLLVTLDYFHSDYFQTVKPILFMEVLITAIFSLFTYFIF